VFFPTPLTVFSIPKQKKDQNFKNLIYNPHHHHPLHPLTICIAMLAQLSSRPKPLTKLHTVKPNEVQ
jgi:hypothetical protein